MADTSTGVQENIAGLLCYVLGWVSGIVFLIIERKNKIVRFHALQSIIVFVALSVVYAVISWIPVINVLLWIVIIVTWIVLMLLALMGIQYKVPWAGNLAEKWAG